MKVVVSFVEGAMDGVVIYVVGGGVPKFSDNGREDIVWVSG